MASDIFNSMFGGLGVPSLQNLGFYAMWFFILLLLMGIILAVFFLMLMKKRQKKVIEINMLNKRVKVMNGTLKKKKGQAAKFWIGRMKKFLPDFQQSSIYTKGTQEVVFLVKDDNGMHHTARLPDYEELRTWYEVMEGVDITQDKHPNSTKIREMFLLPTPHEDLDWLANQTMEAEKEFAVNQWWQSPTIAYAITGFICFLMLMGTIVLTTN